jgi:hypothetical protein
MQIKILLSSFFLLICTQISFATETASRQSAILPNLADVEPPFDSTFSNAGSCINFDTREAANWSTKKDSGYIKHYFFFSLLDVFKNKKKLGEYRFYRNSEFKSEPAFKLNSEGLYEGEKKLCSWFKPYDEKYIFANYLPDCLEKKLDAFLKLYNNEEGQYDLNKCLVFEISSYTKKDKNFFIKANIGNEEFFLDTSDMPDIQNGTRLHTYEMRQQREFKRLTHEAKESFAILKKIKGSPAFKKMSQCLLQMNDSCLEKIFPLEFTKQLGTNGDKRVCFDSKSSLVNEECLKHLKTRLQFIAKKLLTYLVDGISDLNNVQIKATKKKNPSYLLEFVYDSNDSTVSSFFSDFSGFLKISIEVTGEDTQFVSIVDD